MRGKRYCNGLPGVPGVVLQADYLITRQNNAIFADIQVVVCLCKHCHSWNLLAVHIRKARYDQLVKTLLSPDRVVLSSYGTETVKYFLSSSTNCKAATDLRDGAADRAAAYLKLEILHCGHEEFGIVAA